MPLHVWTAALAVALLGAAAASAQEADTLLTWRTYDAAAVARVRLFPSNDDDRPRTAVVDELAQNRSGLVTDDARFLAETIGRTFGFDPAEAFFVFRFSGESFCEGAAATKALLLRATFSRSSAGRLNMPNWRIISRDELATLTDRALY